jgi:NADH:ubiquinone oxidoreductase subunit C
MLDNLNFNKSILHIYDDKCEFSSLLNIAVYRTSFFENATFFKLSSIYNCDIAVDALAIDSIENEYRFTVIYNIQSSLFNFGLRLSTKTKDGLAMISLQTIYPAFN